MALISPTIVDVVGLEFLAASQGLYVFILGSAGLGGPVFSSEYLFIKLSKKHSYYVILI